MPPFARSIGPLREQCRRVGFWLAVAIPPLYVPLLVAGPEVPWALPILTGLLALNLLGLILGHGYRARRDRRNDRRSTRNATRPST